MELSGARIAKLQIDENVTTAVLVRICLATKVDLPDICKLSTVGESLMNNKT